MRAHVVGHQLELALEHPRLALALQRFGLASETFEADAIRDDCSRRRWLQAPVRRPSAASSKRSDAKDAPPRAGTAGGGPVQGLTGVVDNGIIDGMKAAIDSAGRIVVPKPLRDALGLRPGQELEVTAQDGRLEIAIAATPMRLEKRGKGVVAVPEAAVPTLTSVEVRDALDKTRR
jgi:AbrB family looped-hinge helix DNA binding protein